MKAWFGFAAIAGIGFGIGFFAGERYGRKNEKKQQMDQLRVEEETRKIEEKKQEEQDRRTIVHAANEYYPQGLEDIDLDSMTQEADAYLAQFESPEEDKEEEEKPAPAHPEEKYIQIVNEDVWDQNVDYAPVELRYFDQDEVVVDESDERVEEPEDSIGNQVLGYFQQFDDLEEQFVLNNWTMEIFRISRVRDAYARAILGLDEDFEFYNSEND